MNHVRSSLAIEQENNPILLGDYLYSHAYHLHFWRLKSPLLPPITFSSVAREAVALGLVATPATASVAMNGGGLGDTKTTHLGDWIPPQVWNTT